MKNENEDEVIQDKLYKNIIPEIGKTYPIYGMITNIVEEIDSYTLNINYNVTVVCKKYDDEIEKLNTIKEYAFEIGIFVITITDIDTLSNTYKGNLEGVIFGKKQSYNC